MIKKICFLGTLLLFSFAMISCETEDSDSTVTTYTVTFKNEKGKPYTYETNESTWNNINVGDAYDLEELGGNFKKR